MKTQEGNKVPHLGDLGGCLERKTFVNFVVNGFVNMPNDLKPVPL
jgi:hypothetical protein